MDRSNTKEMGEWENCGKAGYYWIQDHSSRTAYGLQSADSAVTEVTHGPPASLTSTTGECYTCLYILGKVSI
jgi:hypothetical protein